MAEEEFHGRGPDGASVTCRIVTETGAHDLPAQPPFRVVRYRLRPGNEPVVVKAAAGRPAERLLRAEIDAYARLGQACGRPPRQVVPVRAADVTSRPHRLLVDFPGECLADWSTPDRLHGSGLLRLDQAIGDLFTALAELDAARLVHGRIGPGVLWWSDQAGLRLTGLETAVPAGEPMPRRAATRWDPPGFTGGVPASHQHDVHSAALIAFWLATGEEIPQGSSRQAVRDQLAGQDDWVRERLLWLFPAGDALPRAQAVLRRLRPAQDIVARLADQEVERQLGKARDEFRDLRGRTARARAAAPPPGHPAAGPRPPRRWPWLRALQGAFGFEVPSSMTPPVAASPAVIECPVCVTPLDWQSAERVADNGAGRMVPLDLSSLRGRAVENRLARAYRVCPGTAAVPAHHLPEQYPALHTAGADPVRIGVIGATRTGKSHLLAAMIHQFTDAAAARRYGIQVRGLDLLMYQAYQDSISPFIRDREELAGTKNLPHLDFTVGLSVTDQHSGRSHTVVIFDMAGERLQSSGPENDFLRGLNALLCVADPTTVLGLARRRGDPARTGGDPATANVLAMLKHFKPRADPFLTLPCALVVTKSDLLRYRGFEEVNRWLNESPEAAADLGTVEQESQDVYAMLRARGAEDWLPPALECWDATLHLASASGCAPEGHRFPAHAFRHHRVLRPLLSLLAMRGVISGERVGHLGRGDRVI